MQFAHTITPNAKMFDFTVCFFSVVLLKVPNGLVQTSVLSSFQYRRSVIKANMESCSRPLILPLLPTRPVTDAGNPTANGLFLLRSMHFRRNGPGPQIEHCTRFCFILHCSHFMRATKLHVYLNFICTTGLVDLGPIASRLCVRKYQFQ